MEQAGSRHAKANFHHAQPVKRLPPVVLYHDMFNLISLALLNALNVNFLATGQHFTTFYIATMLYFMADLIYVGVVPRCVKSPMVILAHHLISAVYILIPWHYPQYGWCMSYCMLVEINTWLLIAKRTFPNKQVLEVLFYVSWVALRCVWYPFLIWVFYKEWRRQTIISGTPYNAILITPFFQVFLTGLNFHWTWALIKNVSDRKLKQL